MNVLGLSFANHESAAALVVDGRLVFAISRERVSRQKRDGIAVGTCRTDLSPSIAYCLDAAGLSPRQIDVVVWSHIDNPSFSDLAYVIRQENGVALSHCEWIALPHHFAHAFCAHVQSGFKDAAIMIVDGTGHPLEHLAQRCVGPEVEDLKSGRVIVQSSAEGFDGSREVESYYECRNGRIRTIRKVTGIPMWSTMGPQYNAATTVLFDNPLDCGKTMGLAGYGSPAKRRHFMQIRPTGHGPVFMPCYSSERAELESVIQSWRDANHGRHIEECNDACTYAATIQFETEESLLEAARWLRRTTGLDNLCYAGGVALNCVANTRLAIEAGFERVFVPFAPGDDGVAIGCALFGAAVHDRLDERGLDVPYLGAASRHESAAEWPGIKRVPMQTSPDEFLAREIAHGAVVAFVQSASEFGPRALGNRSFLADPRNPQMKQRLNSIIKRRERFRPFAPAVLKEHVCEYFCDILPSRYMSFVGRVRDDRRKMIPAVVHVDGTARYQALSEIDNPTLYRLIETFRRLTGVPMLVNTSFNQAGEPLVESSQDAVKCFLVSGADYLAIDGRVYRRIP